MGAPSWETDLFKQSGTNLNDVFGLGKTASSGFGSAGGADLDQVRKYFGTLLGGNRTALAGAAAPAANATRAAADATKRQEASMGTARTGGTAAHNASMEDQIRSEIGTLMGSLAPQAAGQLASIGQTEISAMLQALGLSGSAAGGAGTLVGADIASQRQKSAEMWSSLIGGIAKGGLGALSALFPPAAPLALPAAGAIGGHVIG